MRNRIARIALTAAAVSLGVLLAGCDTFDPTAIFDAEIFNTKKKLQGERKSVFPDGTPGVPQGVPQERGKGLSGAGAGPPACGAGAQGGSQAEAQAESRGQAEGAT